MPEGGGLLGVVLAGGRSRRFGTDKATADLAGEPMAGRVGRKLEPRVERMGVVANDPTVAGGLPWPARPDLRPGLGPAGGILTALSWARDVKAHGALVLACDLPMVQADLLDLLIRHFKGERPVAPASPGPLGVEPLCAVYPVAALRDVDEALSRGPIPAHDLLARLSPEILPLERVASVCDPERTFLNVNRVRDRDLAETLLGEGPE